MLMFSCGQVYSDVMVFVIHDVMVCVFDSGHRPDRDDTVRDGRHLDTPNRTGDKHKYHSSFGSDRHDDRYRYHLYRRSDKGFSQMILGKKRHQNLMEK